MKVIPDILISDEYISSAEKKIFNAAKALTGYKKWYIIHSLFLPQHIKQRKGEIDFILLGPRGLFVIEVKGVVKSVKDGVWDFGYAQSTKSPLVQASNNLESLLSRINDEIGIDFKLNYQSLPVSGYGAIITDTNFTEDSEEWPYKIVLDKTKIDSNQSGFLTEYIKDLADYHTNILRNINKTPSELSDEQITKIMDFLRPDFDFYQSPKKIYETTNANLINLTKEQYKSIDLVFNDNPRIIFDGGAGTGKTFLAMEIAKRYAKSNLKILFLTFNPILAEYIKFNLSDKNILVSSVHKFLVKKLTEKKDYNIYPEEELLDSKKYTEELPSDLKNEINGKEVEKFDIIILDEAQDFFSFHYYDVLQYFIKSGWENGNWYIFMDSLNQTGLQGCFESELLKLIKDVIRPTIQKLTQNCRNTKKVVLDTKSVTGLDFTTSSEVEGPQPKYIFYEDYFELYDQIENELKIEKKFFSQNEISFLTPNKVGKSELHLKLNQFLNVKFLTRNSPFIFPLEETYLVNISDFKGLENAIIFLIEIDENSIEIINKLYVGMTRGSYQLVVFAEKKIERLIMKKLNNRGKNV